MSTTPTNLGSVVPQDATQAPDVQMPVQAPPSNITQTTPQMPMLASQAPQRSRLMSTFAAIVGATDTALTGIPDRGRPSFVTGLGQGARAEQAAQQQQQDVKFKTFDDQVRAAQLHNQDLALQAHLQEQADAHESHMQAMH